jgi:hypothetical protein
MSGYRPRRLRLTSRIWLSIPERRTEHPVRQAVDTHRRWFKNIFEEMLGEIGVTDVSAAADQLIMLRDGAMVGGYLGDPETIARSLHAAGSAVIEHHRSSGGQAG